MNFLEELKKCGDSTYETGYRIVYFYKDKYQISSWASDIKNFMYDFVECCPIESDEDVPEFISIDDILNRCILSDKKLVKVAIYSINGELIKEKYK